jgi:hypothetical protein
MKKLIGVILLVAAAQVQAQGPEADLDGNASALQASEIKPARQSPRAKVQIAKGAQVKEAKQQSVAAAR